MSLIEFRISPLSCWANNFHEITSRSTSSEKILRNHLFKTEDVDEAIEWSEWNEADEKKRNVFAEMQFAFYKTSQLRKNL